MADANLHDRIVGLMNMLWGADLKPDASASTVKLIDDLKVDNLDLVELAMAIEEEFSIEISDDEFEPFAGDVGGEGGKTVGDLVAMVEAKMVLA